VSTRPVLLLCLFAGLLTTRLAHRKIVWIEEAYPTAAAIQMLDGKALYKDIWFDKPPLFPAVYLLWDARIGVPLRVAGALFVFGCCLLGFLLGSRLWSTREGLAAAAVLAFFLTFDTASAVMALAPDLLMIAPHIAAIYCATRGRPFLAGLLAGTAVLINSKGIFVLAACLLWTWRSWLWTCVGFALPNVAAFAWFGAPYYQQVWKWGAAYSSQGFSFATGFLRTGNWIGFHAAIVMGAIWFLWKERSGRMLAWCLLAILGVAAGWRFFPRYYFLLLVPATLMAARGYVLLGRRRALLLMLLVIPLVRFGPRYFQLDKPWIDLALNHDSEAAARMIAGKPGTLLVWGYRPDVFAYTGMQAGTRFLDSQPLTGVLADRHLTNSQVTFPELAARNRQELSTTRPTFIVDGLGPLNAALSITNYPDLKEWLTNYREIGRTEFSIILERRH
jgi:hypothetical protein